MRGSIRRELGRNKAVGRVVFASRLLKALLQRSALDVSGARGLHSYFLPCHCSFPQTDLASIARQLDPAAVEVDIVQSAESYADVSGDNQRCSPQLGSSKLRL